MRHAKIAANRVWRDNALVAADVEPARLADFAADPTCLSWIDLVNPTPDELALLARPLSIGAAATEDALGAHERPKIHRHNDYLSFTIYATELDPKASDNNLRLRQQRISGFLLPHALITIRPDRAFDMDSVVQAWEDEPAMVNAGGSAALIYGLLDVVVDGHFATIQALDDECEELEDVLFDESATDREFQRRVYGLRKDLVALRRIVLPMREMVNGLLRHRAEKHLERSALDVWYDDLYDHVLRAAEWTESLRDMITSIFETNLSLQDARLNVVMKKLAAWAAIIAVPTAITGWFGQNVPYPGFSQAWGVWESVGLIVVCSALLYWLFRSRDWL